MGLEVWSWVVRLRLLSMALGVAADEQTGGISWYSNRHGWVSDSILSYEIVLPNASVQNVTKDSDPDLFWALHAGTNNFGIVTNVQMKTIPYTPTWR